MDNLNANHYALDQVFIVRTNLPLDFEWSPYWIGPSGRHLENRMWVRQNNDEAYFIETIQYFFYTVRTFLQPQIPTILALSFRIVAILNLRLLSAILKFENCFIKV